MAPLDTVLDLAEELRQKFAGDLKKIAQDMGRADEPPTFSVGIVIAHMQTPIGRVRRLVGEAEALAKGSDKKDPRNALAIIVAPRSGTDMSFRARWERKPAQKRDGAEQDEDEQDKQKSPVEELNELAKLYRNDELPSGFGYELRQIDQLVHDMGEKAGEIAELEMKRILNRKNQGGGGKKVDDDTRKTVRNHAKGKAFADVWQQHLIARWLGAHGEERG
jgi:CRISPR/Cas system-associated protein Cas10 (large subunit of type III CRISPR-Cas system)